jgi:PTS system nitrogen regulatory IIA component
LKGLVRPLLSIGVVARPGVDFGAADGKPVRLFVLVVSPSDSPAEHLQVLAAISRWVKADSHAEKVLESKGAEEIYRLLRQDLSA